MAGPHVAGLVALMWSANPQLRGHVDETEALIRETAGDQTVRTCPLATGEACTCGEEKTGATPNYTFGYGVINALEAVKAALH
jgi:subtilisin family serine protease